MILKGGMVPKKLAVLAVAFALVLGIATPSFAIAQEEPPLDGLQPQPAPEGQDVDGDPTVMPASTVSCSQQVAPQEEMPAASQEVTELPAANPDSNGNQCAPQTDTPIHGTTQSCVQCGEQVAKAAQEAITGSDTGPSPTETFGAALQAARDAGGSATREAEALEEAQQSSTPVGDSEAAAYQAAFEAAQEAGADDETAKETAKQAVTEAAFEDSKEAGASDEAAREVAKQAVIEAVSSAEEATTDKASKTSNRDPSEGGSGESIAATKGKTGKDDGGKDNVSEEETTKGDADNASEEETASTEETTDDEDSEVAATGEEDGGSGGGDAAATPAGSRTPLLLGGVALLSVGGFAGLRFARLWSPVRGRRLLGN